MADDDDVPPCMKCLTKIFNTISWLVGILTIGVGLWACVDQRRRGLLTDTDSSSTFVKGAVRVYILPAAGALLMVSGPLGYYGTTKKSKCMMGLFFFFLLLIFAVEVDMSIWVLSNQAKLVCCNPVVFDELFYGMLRVVGAVGILIAVMVFVMIVLMLLFSKSLRKCLKIQATGGV